jgi:hypothetical protein
MAAELATGKIEDEVRVEALPNPSPILAVSRSVGVERLVVL